MNLVSRMWSTWGAILTSLESLNAVRTEPRRLASPVTIASLVLIVLRRWYVILLGAILTLTAAAALWGSSTSIYYSRMEVRFVEGALDSAEAYLERPNEAIVPFVAAVERSVNDGEGVIPLNSHLAEFHGIGVRRGTRVTMPNYGTQWTASYPIPALVIEVVDDRPSAVVEAHREALAEIESAARRLQDEQGIPLESRISIVPAAAEPSVADVGATRAGKARALIVVMMLGMGLTMIAAVTWDRRARRTKDSSAVPVRTPDLALQPD